MKIKLFYLVLIVTAILFSCQKDSQIIDTPINPITTRTDTDTIFYEYYLDGTEVTEDSFDLEDSTLFFITITDTIADTDNGLFKINAFTTEAKFIKFGEDEGVDLESLLLFEEHMAYYADTSGAIDFYDAYDSIPQWYLDYEDDYFDTVFDPDGLKNNSVEERGSYMMLHDYCKKEGGGSRPMIKAIARMKWSGWNDRVSAHFDFAFYGVFVPYWHSWYKKRMHVFWNRGWEKFCYTGPFSWMDNEMSSCFGF